MTGMNFRSDNVAPVAPSVLEAILAANNGPAPAYGGDPLTRRLDQCLGALFETDVAAFPVASGTAANCLALAGLLSDGGAVLCHEHAHIAVAESGAPTFFTGSDCIGLAGEHGRIDRHALERTLDRLNPASTSVLSLTQVTEWGTVYPVQEVAALCEAAHARGLSVHMDGARFANAVAALGCSPADITWRAGVDALAFGASKNGTLNAEAVVFFANAVGATIPRDRKRSGHLYSKMRYVSAQLEAYLHDGLWLELARGANDRARRLADGLAAIPGVRFAAPVDANLLFVDMPEAMLAGLRSDGFLFEPWRGGPTVRLVTSYATTDDDVDALVAAARNAAQGEALSQETDW